MQESKKQRFATLTNDEYATLSTLLQERESINTRRTTDMAVRTFQSYINDKALNLNLCFKFLGGIFCSCYIIKQLLTMSPQPILTFSGAGISHHIQCLASQ